MDALRAGVSSVNEFINNLTPKDILDIIKTLTGFGDTAVEEDKRKDELSNQFVKEILNIIRAVKAGFNTDTADSNEEGEQEDEENDENRQSVKDAKMS